MINTVQPSQGHTLAVMQAYADATSVSVVNTLRLLGRWTRMFTIPNQSSVPMAYKEFDEAGSMRPSAYYDRRVPGAWPQGLTPGKAFAGHWWDTTGQKNRAIQNKRDATRRGFPLWRLCSHLPLVAPVCSLMEICNHQVAGSSPAAGTKNM